MFPPIMGKSDGMTLPPYYTADDTGCVVGLSALGHAFGLPQLLIKARRQRHDLRMILALTCLQIADVQST